MKQTTRRCAYKDETGTRCTERFTPRSMTHKACIEHAVAVGRVEAQKRDRKAARQSSRQAAQDRRKTKERLLELEPLSYWEKRAEKEVNRYVRYRDLYAGHGCISCDKPNNWEGQWHASHLKSVGANSFLRYHLWNIHLACSQCNREKSGNIGEYTERLPGRIGLDRFEFLKTAPRVKRYTREYLDRLYRVFKKKADRMQARYERNK